MNSQQSVENVTDEDKSLFKTKLFWAAIFTPIIIAGIIIGSIFYIEDLSFDWSHNGLNNLFIYFKFPFAIAALSFPFVAFVIANHRSHQMLRQINTSLGQQIFSNYTHHLDQFKEFCLSDREPINSLLSDAIIRMTEVINYDCFMKSAMLGSDEIGNIGNMYCDGPISPWKLHKSLYPEARNGNFNISEKIINHIKAFKNSDTGCNYFYNERKSFDEIYSIKYFGHINHSYFSFDASEKSTEMRNEVESYFMLRIHNHIKDVLIEVLLKFDGGDNETYIEILRD